MTESTKEIEVVLVVPTNVINALQFKQGLNLFKDFGVDIFDTVLDPSHLFFFPRDEMEKDPDFRQLIPYVVFVHKNSVYTYQRMKGQGEKRLHGKWSVGVGGHINRDDKDSSQDYYLHGMLREMVEEIEILSPIKRHVMVGFINDESNAVGKVHLGVLHAIELEHPLVTAIDDSMLDKGFLPIEEWDAGAVRIPENLSHIEGWSQIVLKFLQETLADTEVCDWKKLEGRVLPTNGFKVKHPTPEFESLWPEAGIAVDTTEKPRDMLSEVGQPLLVQELPNGVGRVASGATTAAEEMVKNLDQENQKVAEVSPFVAGTGMMGSTEPGQIVTAENAHHLPCGSVVRLKMRSDDPAEYDPGVLIHLHDDLWYWKNDVGHCYDNLDRFKSRLPGELCHIPIIKQSTRPDVPLRWNEVEVVSGPGYECGVVSDVTGTLSVVIRRVGEPWPIDLFDEPKARQVIQPSYTTYVIQADK